MRYVYCFLERCDKTGFQGSSKSCVCSIVTRISDGTTDERVEVLYLAPTCLFVVRNRSADEVR